MRYQCTLISADERPSVRLFVAREAKDLPKLRVKAESNGYILSAVPIAEIVK